MGFDSAIEWTEATWNPWIGCTKVSNGCKNCYMYNGVKRWGRDPTVVRRTKPATLNAPLKWKEPRLIFVCSWSDFFHEDADPFRQEAYDIMYKCPQHTFLLLTKRPERIEQCLPKQLLVENLWFGATVEDKAALNRIEILRELQDKHGMWTFLSCEPLLEDLGELNLAGIDWLIAGGESGPKARPCRFKWLRDIRDQCVLQRVPFFLKQIGGHPDKYGGKKATLDGRRWTEKPEHLKRIP